MRNTRPSSENAPKIIPLSTRRDAGTKMRSKISVRVIIIALDVENRASRDPSLKSAEKGVYLRLSVTARRAISSKERLWQPTCIDPSAPTLCTVQRPMRGRSETMRQISGRCC
jgi:hypothetical protein